jgi:beta-N-acetylhexosaminidase
MNQQEKIGQLITVGGIIGGLAQAGGESAVHKAIAAGEVGGVYVGYPHFQSPAHARQIIEKLQKLAPTPLFVAADFETGPAYNCEGVAAHLPYLRGLGFIDDPAITRQAAEITARQALAMGINWLYSPCLDVNLRPDNPIVGIRSFGETPELVSRMGNAFIQACRDVGVICTAKHFPGCGNTVADTHIGNAQDVGDLATWETKSLPPFEDAIRNGVPSVMTGHAAMPFLDPTCTPATFSAPILTGILRQRLGYDGLIVTDSLGMDGASGGVTLAERCLRAFEAGCDVLLTPYDAAIIPLFEKALQSGRLSQSRLDASVARVLEAKARLAKLPRLEIRPDDEAAARAIGRRAARVLTNNGALPLVPGTFAVITQWRNDEAQYFPREPGVLAGLQHGLQLVDPMAPLIPASRLCLEQEHTGVLMRVGDRQTVVFNAIVKNYAGDPLKGLLSEGAVSLLAKLKAAGKRVVLALLGSPYPAAQAPEADAVICTGGDTLGSVEGALELLQRAPGASASG